MTELRPLRIAHLADTHLGFSALTRLVTDDTANRGRNQRAVDIEHAFAAAVTDIIESPPDERPDLVLHAGDAFHHSRPPMGTLIFFIRQLRRLEAAGLPVVLIGGNHDTPRLRHAGSVLDLCAIACPGTHFVAGYECEDVRFALAGRQVRIAAAPHGAFTNDQAPVLLPSDDPDVTEILVAHGAYGLKGMPGYHGDDDIEANLIDEAWDYVALGHWHEHDRKGAKTYYSGSTERIGIGDLHVTPGYARVELTKGELPRVRHVPVPARDVHAVPPLHDAQDLTAEQIVGEVEKRLRVIPEATRAQAMVLCRVVDAKPGMDREVTRMLRATEVAKSCWAFVPTVQTLRMPGAQVEETQAIGQLRDEFEGFVTRREADKLYEPAFAGSFREKGAALLDDAMRRAQQRDAEDAG